MTSIAFTKFLPAILGIGLLLSFAGCSIEESDRGFTGSISVLLIDSTGSPIEGGEIFIDGQLKAQRTQLTPVLVAGVEVGSRVVRLRRVGFIDAVDTLDVAFNQVTEVTLQTTIAPPAVIELSNVPDSTFLLVNGLAFGRTPPAYFTVGSGTLRISAYLAGHATALPSYWIRTLIEGDTANIAPVFELTTIGSAVGNLVPPFALADDLDSATYRMQDQRGLVTIATFFFYNCVPCLQEYPHFQAVYSDPQYAGEIQMFGIDPQDPYAVFRTYREDHPDLGLTFPLLHGNEPLRAAYNVQLYPTNFVIDRTGKIRYRLGSLTEAVLRDAVETLLAEE